MPRTDQETFIKEPSASLNNMKKQILTIIISSIMSIPAFAQQPLQESNTYFLMPFGLSPAYSGLEGDISLGISYRNHWTGVTGSPNRTGLLLGAAVSEKVGLGLTATNNSGGVFNQNNIRFNYTYHIPFSGENKLSLSMQAGYVESTVNSTNSNTDFSTDPLLAQRAGLRQSVFNAGAAALFSSKMFEAGVYTPNLFGNQSQNDETYANNIDQTLYGTSVLLHAGFKKEMADGSMLRLTGIGRGQRATPFNYEFSAAYHIRQMVLLGASIRQQGIFAVHGGYTTNNLKFMYSYEFPGSIVSGSMPTTHEVNLIISLPERNLNQKEASKKKKEKSPEQLKIEENEERLEKLNNNLQYQSDKIQSNTKRIYDLEERADAQDEKLKNVKNQSNTPGSPSTSGSGVSLGERISSLVEMNQEMNKKETSATEKALIKAEYDKEVTAINNELNNQNQTIELIAGAFSQESGAKKTVAQLKAKGVKANYFYRSDKKLYYVSAGSYKNVNEALTKKNSLNRRNGVYTWLFVR